ncbi:MAG: Fic family protein [Bacteroidota bacterium]
MLQKYYEGTSKIINLSTEIGRLLGIVDATHLRKPRTELRKRNKVKTIRASLAIEGNTLSEEQVTAIIENKRVIGPAKDILEVKNAIAVYDKLDGFNPFSEESYLEAHGILMKGLVENAGRYRTKGVGIVQGDKVAHLAPPGWNIPNLMNHLFNYLKDSEDNLLLKSCVFHYEMEFIHPFYDGNGRMGRLWQTVILMRLNPVFEYLPVEKAIKDSQEEYYRVLNESDKAGLSTSFVEYALEKIKLSLEELVSARPENMNNEERMTYFLEQHKGIDFSRKEYMQVFPKISGATASRDLQKALENDLLIKTGDKRLTRYSVKN